MQLTKSEEAIMQIIWSKQKVFMKEILTALPTPKPAVTTVATLLKRMSDKGFITYTIHGRNREYAPLVSKKEYFAKHVNTIIHRFFNDSAAQFASFFTEETNLSKSELESLRALIDQQIKKK